MNLKKFNIFKNALYFYIASGILLVAGLVIGILFGMNTTLTIGNKTYLYSVLSVLIFSLCAFIYFLVRHEVYMAITNTIAILHNTMLTTALTTLFRVEIDDSFMMVLLLVSFITVLFNFLLFSNVKEEDRKPGNKEEMVNKLVDTNLKTIVLIASAIIALLIVMIFSFEANMINLIRPLLIGIVVSVYAGVFMVMPFWGYFVKEKKNRKIDETEKDYIK